LLKNKTNLIFYVLGLLYVLIQAYLLVTKKDMFMLFCLLPAGLIFVFSFLFSIERIVWMIVIVTPLSMPLKEFIPSSSVDLSLPGEPLMAGLLLISLFYLSRKLFIDKHFLRHPITIIIFIQLLWILITAFNSTMPLVSFKFLIARLWFINAAMLFTSTLLKEFKNIPKYILCYAIPLSVIIILTLIKHAGLGFDEDSADWIVQPYYNDHTAYGAAISMFIPVIASLAFYFKDKKKLMYGLVILLGILLIGVIFSYARAAWLSIAASLVILAALLLKLKFRTLLIGAVSLVLVFLVFQTQIMILLAKNDTDSEGDLAQNIESMSNISTDASNVERLNRWSCALRMYDEKPLMGWGPGTYMFQYAAFQKSSEATIITVNDGSNGNAHSEYLGPLSEQGIPGLLMVVVLMLSIFFTGFRLVYTIIDKKLKYICIGVLLGLTTYFVHGFLNNFLDTDKLSIPFWGFITILICIDIYHKKTQNIANPEEK